MKSMNPFILSFILIIVSLAGCSQKTMIKYQCQDGSIVSLLSDCNAVAPIQPECPKQECPKNDCSICPPIINTREIIEKIFICPDGETEVKDKEDCKKESNFYSYEDGLSVIENSQELKNEIGEGYNLHSPAEGSIFLVLDMTFTNTGTEEISINPVYMKLKDEDGYIYQFSLTTVSTKNYFDGTDIKPDDFVRGKVVFEIPEKKKNFLFIFEQYEILLSIPIKIT